jgi:hypothetical protein
MSKSRKPKPGKGRPPRSVPYSWPPWRGGEARVAGQLDLPLGLATHKWRRQRPPESKLDDAALRQKRRKRQLGPFG